MKTNKITVEVTKKHFDAAYAAVEKGKQLTTTCLLAQAIKALFPKKSVHVYSTTAHVGKVTYDLPARAQNLITRFDALTVLTDDLSKAEKKRIAKFRASLPVSFKMTEHVEEKAEAATA